LLHSRLIDQAGVTRRAAMKNELEAVRTGLGRNVDSIRLILAEVVEVLLAREPRVPVPAGDAGERDALARRQRVFGGVNALVKARADVHAARDSVLEVGDAHRRGELRDVAALDRGRLPILPK